MNEMLIKFSESRDFAKALLLQARQAPTTWRTYVEVGIADWRLVSRTSTSMWGYQPDENTQIFVIPALNEDDVYLLGLIGDLESEEVEKELFIWQECMEDARNTLLASDAVSVFANYLTREVEL